MSVSKTNHTIKNAQRWEWMVNNLDKIYWEEADEDQTLEQYVDSLMEKDGTQKQEKFLKAEKLAQRIEDLIHGIIDKNSTKARQELIEFIIEEILE